MVEDGVTRHSGGDGVQRSLRPERRVWPVVMTLAYLAIGIQCLLVWRLPTVGLAFFFFAKSYIHFFWGRFVSPESDDLCLADWPRAFKVGGVLYILGALCLFIAPLAGEHWGWLILAVVLLLHGIAYSFGPRLSVPSRWLWQSLPSRWFP